MSPGGQWRGCLGSRGRPKPCRRSRRGACPSESATTARRRTYAGRARALSLHEGAAALQPCLGLWRTRTRPSLARPSSQSGPARRGRAASRAARRRRCGRLRVEDCAISQLTIPTPTTATSRPQLGHISATSRPHLGHISAAPRQPLGSPSAAPRPLCGNTSAAS